MRNRYLYLLFIVSAAGLLSSCAAEAADEPGDESAEATPELTEEGNPLSTAPEPDDGTLRLVTQPLVIPPASETVMCEYLEPLAHDVWISGYDTYQGQGGHHLVLFSALKKKTPGTRELCPGSMENALPVLAPTAAPRAGFAKVRFPEDTALLVKAGTQLIVQTHYVNTGDETLVYSDVADLHTLSEADGARRRTLHVYAAAVLDFEVAPGSELTVGFDCELPYDMTFVTILGHMHEYGQRFYSQAGPADDMKMILEVPTWTPDMRDLPPSVHFETLAERPEGTYGRGDLQRTVCTWSNSSEHTLAFPQEMCATFAYFYSDDPAANDHVCAGRRIEL